MLHQRCVRGVWASLVRTTAGPPLKYIMLLSWRWMHFYSTQTRVQTEEEPSSSVLTDLRFKVMSCMQEMPGGHFPVLQFNCCEYQRARKQSWRTQETEEDNVVVITLAAVCWNVSKDSDQCFQQRIRCFLSTEQRLDSDGEIVCSSNQSAPINSSLVLGRFPPSTKTDPTTSLTLSWVKYAPGLRRTGNLVRTWPQHKSAVQTHSTVSGFLFLI